MAGLVLDDWQRTVLDVSLGELAGGRWCAKTVDVFASRQNGKNAAVEARELYGAVILGEVVFHTAHEFKTAKKSHKRLWDLIKAHPDISERVTSQYASPASGYIVEFDGGGSVEFIARSTSSGRGFTGDLLILDEAQNLTDDQMGALLPALSARSVEGDPQIWYLGSAPDIEQVFWQRRRRNGRNGAVPFGAFFEFSADPDADLDDRDAWAQANPGLNIRISEEFVEVERAQMSDEVFARERLSISPDVIDADDRLSIDAWRAILAATKPAGPLVFSLDCTPDRTWAAICAADGTVVELVDHRRGVGWVVDRAAALWTSWQLPFVVDGSGPAGSLGVELERRGVPVTFLASAEVVKACNAVYDDIVEQRFTVLDPFGTTLGAAIGAVKKRSGDTWRWNRRGDADISPLMAVTFARWMARPPTTFEPLVAWR